MILFKCCLLDMNEEKAGCCLMESASKRRTEHHNFSCSLLLCYADVSVVSGTVSCCGVLYGFKEPINHYQNLMIVVGFDCVCGYSEMNIFFCGQVGGIPRKISRTMKRNVTNLQNLL